MNLRAEGRILGGVWQLRQCPTAHQFSSPRPRLVWVWEYGTRPLGKARGEEVFKPERCQHTGPAARRDGSGFPPNLNEEGNNEHRRTTHDNH